MNRDHPPVSALKDSDVSAADLYLVVQRLYREMDKLSGQLDEISTRQQRFMESKLNALYRPKDIARMVNVHHHTVLDWIKKGRLVPTEGTKVSGWELERFLKESSRYRHLDVMK